MDSPYPVALRHIFITLIFCQIFIASNGWSHRFQFTYRSPLGNELTKRMKQLSLSFAVPLLVFTPHICEHAAASNGAAPKQEFFKADTQLQTGPPVYDEGAKSIIAEKKKSIQTRWDSMTAKIEKDLTTGNTQAAKTTMANAMTGLKSDMRRISKVRVSIEHVRTL